MLHVNYSGVLLASFDSFQQTMHYTLYSSSGSRKTHGLFKSCALKTRDYLKFRVIWDHQGDEGSKHLWNVGALRDYTALHPRRLLTSYSTPWEPILWQKISQLGNRFSDRYSNSEPTYFEAET